MRKLIVCAALSACAFWGISRAQEPRKIDFARDVRPIINSRCIGCHGPVQQKNGLRLDRRSDAMRGGTIAVIGPGNSEGSRLYLRLTSDKYGLQMPPTGALSAQDINTFKQWIDQGAEWPDNVSGETPAPPPDPQATQMMEALRNGDHATFQKLLSTAHGAINHKGPGGSTPLMYAALYGDLESVRTLLRAGADPNFQNEAGATALMWATDNLEITNELVEHGADVNAHSSDSRTPLLIAAGRFGAAPVVQLLLGHGANPSAHSPALFGVTTPLAEAAYAGDESTLRLLIARGADVKAAGPAPLGNAILTGCAGCTDLLIPLTSPEDLNMQMFLNAPPLGNAIPLKNLMDHGADAATKDPGGNTALMLAAASDVLPLETIKALIARGVDVNARNPDGKTALDYARARGTTSVVDLLIQSGAKGSGVSADIRLNPKPASTPREAVQRSIPLLQNTGVIFAKKSGCISCHNNTFTAVTVSTARQKHIPVNEIIVRDQLKTFGAYIESWRERVLQGVGIPGDADTISYVLIGLGAEHYPADPNTDALARFLKIHQRADGSWVILAHRPPLESSDIEVTANSLHALQLYAPAIQRAEYDRAISRAAEWLVKAQVKNNEDRVFRLLGLHWAGKDRETTRAAARMLVADQRSDGGWAQIPSLASDAYATGQALVALRESGAISVSDPVYKRGVKFLMSTQLEDGSWYVKSRAIPLQPFFESGFPFAHDQFVSAAGTNWATQALALSAR